MDIIEKLNEAVEILDDIDDYMNNLNQLRSTTDMKISDIQHYIENNKINTFQSYHIVKNLKKVLQERRKIKNDMELAKIYRANDTKLIKKANRESLKNDLDARMSTLNLDYNNRVYSEEEMQELMK